MKKRRIVLGVMGILLLGAWLARVIWFNSTYPDVTRMTYLMGEMVALEKDVIDYSSMEGYEVQVENAKIWEYEDFVEYYQVSKEIRNEVEVLDPVGAPERVYDIEITLKNVGSASGTADGVAFMDWRVQTNCMFSNFNEALYLGVNPEVSNAAIALRDNSEMGFRLVYDLREMHFTPSEWEDMGAVSLWLSVTAYPNKKMIILQ